MGGASEIAREAGNVGGVRVGAQDTDGRNHPFIGEEPGIAIARDTIEALTAAATFNPAHGGPSKGGDGGRKGGGSFHLGVEEADTGETSVEQGAGGGGDSSKGISANA